MAGEISGASDPVDIGSIEEAYACMAQAAGLMASAHLSRTDHSDHAEALWSANMPRFDPIAAGTIRNDINADEFLNATSSLCMSADDGRASNAGRMVDLLLNGLRYPSVLCTGTA